MKKTSLWILSFVITAGFAVFQRMTGPTYPVKGGEVPGSGIYHYRLPRSCTAGAKDCMPEALYRGSEAGYIMWRRYPSDEPFQRLDMACPQHRLFAVLPDQPPAGKIEYSVFIRGTGADKQLGGGPVVARFKGPVPAWILAPHILLMFLFMLFSVRIFLSAAFGLEPVRHSVPATAAFLVLGGFVFGPLTQYYAFGQGWTGFPFGRDLTDNKTLIMLVFWLAALRATLKGKAARAWVIAAFIVTAAVYLVPHSMFGSQLDYKKGEVVTGK